MLIIKTVGIPAAGEGGEGLIYTIASVVLHHQEQLSAAWDLSGGAAALVLSLQLGDALLRLVL